MNIEQERKNYNIFKSIQIPIVDKFNIYNSPHIVKDINVDILMKSPILFESLLYYYEELHKVFKN